MEHRQTSSKPACFPGWLAICFGIVGMPGSPRRQPTFKELKAGYQIVSEHPTIPEKPSKPAKPATNWRSIPLVQQYKLIRKIGKGGFAEVWLAERKSSCETVAIKVVQLIHPDLDADELSTLLSESKFLRSLDCPYLLRCHHVAATVEWMVMVLEYLAGGELFDHLYRIQHYTEAAAAKIFAQIVSAVSYLHNLNIMHRDIKPENVMFVSPVEQCEAEGRPLRVKLIDLGMAAMYDEKKPPTSVVGTPGFIAPEVWNEQPQTLAADIYSLGVLLFIMLTGRKPHSQYDTRKMATSKTVIGRSIRDASGLRDERYLSLSPSARELLLSMLADDPRDRPTALAVLRHPFITAVDSNREAHREMGEQVRWRMRDLNRIRRLHGLHYALRAQRPGSAGGALESSGGGGGGGSVCSPEEVLLSRLDRRWMAPPSGGGGGGGGGAVTGGGTSGGGGRRVCTTSPLNVRDTPPSEKRAPSPGCPQPPTGQRNNCQQQPDAYDGQGRGQEGDRRGEERKFHKGIEEEDRASNGERCAEKAPLLDRCYPHMLSGVDEDEGGRTTSSSTPVTWTSTATNSAGGGGPLSADADAGGGSGGGSGCHSNGAEGSGGSGGGGGSSGVGEGICRQGRQSEEPPLMVDVDRLVLVKALRGLQHCVTMPASRALHGGRRWGDNGGAGGGRGGGRGHGPYGEGGAGKGAAGSGGGGGSPGTAHEGKVKAGAEANTWLRRGLADHSAIGGGGGRCPGACGGEGPDPCLPVVAASSLDWVGLEDAALPHCWSAHPAMYEALAHKDILLGG